MSQDLPPAFDMMSPSADAGRAKQAQRQFEKLLSAVIAQDEALVRALIAEGVDVNGGAHEAGALHFACGLNPGKSNPVIAKLLLDSGAEVNQLHPIQGTALMNAAQGGDEAMVELLLAHGALPQGRVTNGMDAMLVACQGGFTGVVRRLAGAGASLSEAESYNNQAGITPLWMAADFNHLELVRDLLEQGVDPHVPCGRHPSTPLFAAAHRGYDAIASTLLAHGANPEDRGLSDRITALMSAAWHGRTHMVRLLVEAGAKLDVQDEDGNTALHHACRAKTGEKAVSVLLGLGASPHTLNRRRQTPRAVAADNQLVEHLQVLDAWAAQAQMETTTGAVGARKPGARL